MDNFVEEFKNSYEQYEIISSIGRDTWQIKLTSYDRVAVLKRIDNPEVYRKLKELKISGIPTIYSISERDGAFYAIEEFINGSTLDSLVASKGSLTPHEVREIVCKLCRILVPVHGAGLVHRDIKPSNIIITSNNEVYLIDFGIARAQNATASKDTKHLGTEFYASPEQYGFAQTDNKSDIYSIGKLMITLLTGRENADNIKALPYSRIIARCTAVDSSKRYKSVAALRKKFYINYILLGCGIIIGILIASAIILYAIGSNTTAPPDALPAGNITNAQKEHKTNAEITYLEESSVFSETSAAEKITTEEQTTVSQTTEQTTAMAETTTQYTVQAETAAQSSAQTKMSTQPKKNFTISPSVDTNISLNSADSNNSSKYLRITPEGIQFVEDDEEPKIYYNQLEFVPHKYSAFCGNSNAKHYITNMEEENFDYEKYYHIALSGVRHYNADVELSDTLKADIYTEKTDNCLNISINDGSLLSIPEYQPAEDPDLYAEAYRYYSLSYIDFDSDGTKDIFIVESIYDPYHDKYTSPYNVHTFVKIKPDLTMEILENDTPIIEYPEDIEYLVYQDQIDFREKNKEEILGTFICENGKVSCKNKKI